MNASIQFLWKALLYSALLFAAQWVIKYYFIAPAAIAYGAYSISQDRRSPDGWAWLFAGLAIGANAFLFENGYYGSLFPR